MSILLSSPLARAITNTSIRLSAATNTVGGVMYYVVSSSATPPTDAQIKAGNDHTGSAAIAAGSTVPTRTREYEFDCTGLTKDSTYHVYFVQEVGSEFSNIVAASVTINLVEINSIENLNAMRDGLSGKYVLLRNLDFDDDASYDTPSNKTDYTTAAGWVPVGTEGSPFAGYLSGNGKTISNLFINKTTARGGLFGTLEGGAMRVEDLSIIDADVTGPSHATNGGQYGILFGWANAGTAHIVSNISVAGSITAGIDLGGIGGRCDSPVRRCTANVTMVASHGGVGGVFGSLNPSGGDSYELKSSGTVTSSTGNAAGLCSWYANAGGGKLQESFSAASVTAHGSNMAGGLIGWLYNSTVENTYSTGNVSASTTVEVGGHTGNMDQPSATILNGYSIGTVVGSGDLVGGFVGRRASRTVTGCFWDTQTSGTETGDGGTGKTTAQMKTLSTFTDAGWDIVEGVDPAHVWGIDPAINDGYPFLQAFQQSAPASSAARTLITTIRNPLRSTLI
jgi:hypothetical protein